MFRDSAVPYYFVFLFPATLFLGAYFGSWLTLATVLYAFVITPVVDVVTGVYQDNPSEKQEALIEKSLRYAVVPILWVPAQIISLVFCAYAVTHWGFSNLEVLGLTLSMGVNAGVGINVSHELCHRHTSKTIESKLGILLLSLSCYGHFYTEHLFGHHIRVATLEDPASARLGETLYEFLPRTIVGSYRSAWEINARKVKRHGRSVYSIQNPMVVFALISLSAAGLFYFFFGKIAVLMFFGQSVVGIILLEVINYLEHYGLQRMKRDNGRYEPVSYEHSWNSDARFSSYILFKLNRHSDHHRNPKRRYQILRDFEDSPKLPTGYPGMMLLTLVPPVWFFIMDQHVPAAKSAAGRYPFKENDDESLTSLLLELLQSVVTTVTPIWMSFLWLKQLAIEEVLPQLSNLVS